MARAAILIAGVLSCASGCAYHNTLYNAERIYREGEQLRLAGRSDGAMDAYREVARKTGDAYRARPFSPWAGEALLLLGRARLRLGDAEAALSALREAAARVGPERRGAVDVYLAAALAESGERHLALERVGRALQGPLDESTRADAHLLRGGLQLERGQVESGWWDFDRAAEANPDVRVEAGLLRLSAAVEDGDRARATRAVDLLLSYEGGGARLAAVTDGVADARARWGAAAAAELLAGADSARWERDPRDRIRLGRAWLLREAGATTQAFELAWSVARAFGPVSAEARLMLADWQLEAARDLAEVHAVRRILHPSADDPRVRRLLDSVDTVERYASLGLDEPLGWFAAAEVARDELGADYLARGLFLAYADASGSEPWAAKALLAALEVSQSEGDRAWLRDRLEAHRGNPYVLAAHGGPAAGFEALEEELAVRLREIRSR